MTDLEQWQHERLYQLDMLYAMRIYCRKYGKPKTREEWNSVRLGLYQGGAARPRYPVPSIIGGAYVILSAIDLETGAWVVWCADGEILMP